MLAYIVLILGNILSQIPGILPYSQPEIADMSAIMINPSAFAFSIWGVIYALITGFVVYQALPSSWVPGRNDDLIFNKIGFVFMVNLII